MERTKTKRQRKSNQPHNSDGKSQTSGVSLTDLPCSMLFKIFLKLPTMSIVMCKSVCKTWRGIISDSYFVRTHFSKAKECTLIRDMHPIRFSRSLYLFEEDEHRVSNICRCVARDKNCKECYVNKPVRGRLKIPLRDAQDMFSRLGGVSINDASFCRTFKGKREMANNVIEMTPNRDEVVNSCNGFLCLQESGSCYRLDKRYPFLVCNPVTGEFTYLPTNVWDNSDAFLRASGFGFAPERNEYKVVRVLHQRSVIDSGSGPGFGDVVEVHTLGTESWRKLDSWPPELAFCHEISSPVYLDGAVYWILNLGDESYSMVSFDFNEERFQVHYFPFQRLGESQTLIVQGGRLYFYETHMNIWVMNEERNLEYWTKLFSMDISKGELSDHKFPHLSQVVVFSSDESRFIYYDRFEGLKFKAIKFRGYTSTFKAVAYTPSFISLKEIVGRGHVEVLNINSRCGKLKLVEEDRPLFLGGARRVVCNSPDSYRMPTEIPLFFTLQ